MILDGHGTHALYAMQHPSHGVFPCISWPLQSPQQRQLEEWIATHQPVKVYETLTDSASCGLKRSDVLQFCFNRWCALTQFAGSATSSHWPSYLEDPPEERRNASKVLSRCRYLQIFVILTFWYFDASSDTTLSFDEDTWCIVSNGSVIIRWPGQHGDKATWPVLWKNELLLVLS